MYKHALHFTSRKSQTKQIGHVLYTPIYEIWTPIYLLFAVSYILGYNQTQLNYV